MKSERDEFPRSVKEQAWQRCKGHCEHPACRQKIMSGAIYDHYPIAAALGGPGTLKNCRVLCARCNRLQTDTVDIPRISKAKRIDEKRAGLRARPHRSPFRKLMSGEVIRREASDPDT